MKTVKPLIETNPYLRDPVERERLIARSVRTSCGVEGIKSRPDAKPIQIKFRITKKIYSKS